MNWRGHDSGHSTGKVKHCPQWKSPPEVCGRSPLNTALGNFFFEDFILFYFLFSSIQWASQVAQW